MLLFRIYALDTRRNLRIEQSSKIVNEMTYRLQLEQT